MAHSDRDLQRAVRRRQRSTGETYQDALAGIRAGWQRLDNDLRYVLSDDVKAFMRGQGWRGMSLDDVEDLRSWLANLRPVYECRTCGDDGDARTQDTSLHIVAVAYDPDLSPVTGMLTSRRHHAHCAQSTVVWSHRVDIPRGPVKIGVPASARPEIEGEVAITVQPVMLPPELDFDPEGREPALLIRADVTEDHGQGQAAWLSQLEMSLWRPAGFDELFTVAQAAQGWSVRVVRGWPSSLAPEWAAVRITEPEDGRVPDHLYLGALDFPSEWVEAARGRSRLLLLAGPISDAGDVPEVPEKIDQEQLYDLLECGLLLTAYAPFEYTMLEGDRS